MAFACEVARGNEKAWEVVDEHSARIAGLEAEVARLRAEREPPEAQSDALGLEAPGPRTLESTDCEPANHKPAKDRHRVSWRRVSEDARAAILVDLAAGLSQS